ncbi:MAG: hypothetical protein IIY71_01095, partial [Oscillospiraceae bacterium]|nr:hypothetical protein [Oscillospiraceae bacterium]
VPTENLEGDLQLRKAVEFVVANAVEKGSVPPEEGKTVVVTKEDCEPEHHHHDDEEPEAEAEAEASKEEAVAEETTEA